MGDERVQIGTVEITRPRVYPIDPLARHDGLGTEVLVQPGEYPVFCRGGMTYYWQMAGTINGRSERLGDGMFIMRGGDLATADEVVFYSPRFGEDEWAAMLSEAEQAGSALKFRIEAKAGGHTREG